MKLVELTLEFFVSRNDIMSIVSKLPYKVKKVIVRDEVEFKGL